MNSCKRFQDRADPVIRHNRKNNVISLIGGDLFDHSRMIQRFPSLQMMPDSEAVPLQLLLPFSPGQHRHVISGAAEHMRQIASDHAGTVYQYFHDYSFLRNPL